MYGSVKCRHGASERIELRFHARTWLSLERTSCRYYAHRKDEVEAASTDNIELVSFFLEVNGWEVRKS